MKEEQIEAIDRSKVSLSPEKTLSERQYSFYKHYIINANAQLSRKGKATIDFIDGVEKDTIDMLWFEFSHKGWIIYVDGHQLFMTIY